MVLELKWAARCRLAGLCYYRHAINLFSHEELQIDRGPCDTQSIHSIRPQFRPQYRNGYSLLGQFAMMNDDAVCDHTNGRGWTNFSFSRNKCVSVGAGWSILSILPAKVCFKCTSADGFNVDGKDIEWADEKVRLIVHTVQTWVMWMMHISLRPVTHLCFLFGIPFHSSCASILMFLHRVVVVVVEPHDECTTRVECKELHFVELIHFELARRHPQCERFWRTIHG